MLLCAGPGAAVFPNKFPAIILWLLLCNPAAMPIFFLQEIIPVHKFRTTPKTTHTKKITRTEFFGTHTTRGTGTGLKKATPKNGPG